MLKPELNEPVGANAPLLPIHTATVVANHEGEDEMGFRGGKQDCLDVFDGLVGTHWRGRHEVSAGTCQGFTNR